MINYFKLSAMINVNLKFSFILTIHFLFPLFFPFSFPFFLSLFFFSFTSFFVPSLPESSHSFFLHREALLLFPISPPILLLIAMARLHPILVPVADHRALCLPLQHEAHLPGRCPRRTILLCSDKAKWRRDPSRLR
jgi:hypothetical protein